MVLSAPPTQDLDDPDLPLQWSLNNTGQNGGTEDADIDAPEAWWITTGQNIVIAVIDGGIDRRRDTRGDYEYHPEFTGQLWTNSAESLNGIDDDGNGYADDIHGWNFVHNNSDITDNYGHGTSVASIIAAEAGPSGIGMAGICWNCRLMILKVADQRDIEGDVASAIRYAIEKKADVINLSLGVEASDAVERAVCDAVKSGIVVVAATGNGNTENVAFPSRYQEAIAVGATNRNDSRWKEEDTDREGSSFGHDIDLMAPGEDIHVAHLGSAYRSKKGTSFASPHVAGAVALLLSLDRNLSPDEVRKALETTTDTNIGLNIDPGEHEDSYFIGKGRLNLFNALTRVAFSDVKLDDWFNPYVSLAFQEEMIKGPPDWEFLPAQHTSRAEVLRMAYSAAAEIFIQPVPDPKFADVTPSDWFFALVGDAKQKEYIEGSPCSFDASKTCFRPNEPVNRAEALKVISALFKVNPSAPSIDNVINVPEALQRTFPDVPLDAWFYPYAHWMANSELRAERLPSGIETQEALIEGYPDGYFRPGNLINRAEMAKIVVNTMLYCRTGPTARNCNTETASLLPSSTKAAKAAGPVSLGVNYEQAIDPLNPNAPDRFRLPGGDEQIVAAPIPLTGATRDADGDLLFYFWNASGGSFTTSDPVNFSSVTWHPPVVTKDTIFTVNVVRGDRRGLVGRGSFRFLVPGSSSNSPGSGTITGPNGTQTGAVTVSATASDADGLARVFVTFTPNGPTVEICGPQAAALCSGTSGTYSRSGLNPATYGASS
ncbi:MAG TPA: S8 family serine peptidase, partial [Thermoanaerobaculia bacterium]|nr:S8 family serine peptidase [Thermoanaerobaculia bacterium]